MDSSDPVVTSYDVFLTDSEVSRYVLQYLDRPAGHAYDERHGQKPTGFRVKAGSGLVEVDVPINTRVNYDVGKGLRYGDALRKSRIARDGAAHGLAGGFSSGGSAAVSQTVKTEAYDDSDNDNYDGATMAAGDDSRRGELLRVQTLGGRIKPVEDGDPLYMLAAFRDKNLHLSPVAAVVQLHPQLHHIDALDEVPKARGGRPKKDAEDDRPAESEARAIDIKIKGAEDGEIAVPSNLELLKKMQDEKWQTFDWMDAESEESWQTYENYMMHQAPELLPQLTSAISSEDYLDAMSAPRVDPARPEMTGWAMKQSRKMQKEHLLAEQTATEI